MPDLASPARQQEKPLQAIVPAKNFDYKTFTPERFHRCHTLDYKNGLPVQRRPWLGIGGDRLVQDVLLDSRQPVEAKYHVQDDYGVKKYCHLDKKVLRFFAHFRENISGHADQPEERVRKVQILYYLEDDTIAIMEPRVKNSGLFQGLLLRRHRIPLATSLFGEKAFWHWTDIAIGQRLTFYSREYCIDSCDDFTRQYLLSEGLPLKTDEHTPADPYTLKRSQNEPQEKAKLKASCALPDDEEARLNLEVAQESRGKLQKYLQNDGKVLRFYARSDLPKYPLGVSGEQEFIIHFYLADDTIEIRELRERKGIGAGGGVILEDRYGLGGSPDEKEPPVAAGAKFLRRQKLPKTAESARAHEFPSSRKLSRDQYFMPQDFVVGENVYIQNRRFHIYDCDPFTAHYLAADLGRALPQGSRRPPDDLHCRKVVTMTPIPPHLAQVNVGQPEDSMQNCIRLRPKPPKKDLKKFLEFSGKHLRYEARLHSPWSHDTRRKFIFTYYLADDTVSIFEPLPPNSGLLTGKFLERGKLAKPLNKVNGERDFYALEDFYIGSILHVNGRKFEIVGADERVLTYLLDLQKAQGLNGAYEQAHGYQLPPHCVLSLRAYFKQKGLHEADQLKEADNRAAN